MIVVDIVVAIIFYITINVVIKGILWFLFKKDFKFKVYLPKKKKFTTGKISPIYQLEENGYGGFNVMKYEIRYDEDQEWWGMLGILLIPFISFDVQIYKYHQCFMLHYPYKKGTMLEYIRTTNMGNMELSSFYELEYRKLQEEQNAKQLIIDEKQSKIDKLNRIFNENYE